MTMPLALIRDDQAPRMLSEAWARLRRSATGPAGRLPTLLLTLPPTWNNRYQALLYGEAGPRRYAPMGIGNTASLGQISWPGPIVLHAHWFASLFSGCDGELTAGERFETVKKDILAFRDRTNARLVWTAHNVFPHGNLFPETYLRLRQWVFENFDAIHVMQDEHLGILENTFGHKAPHSFTVPHMLYNGSFPDSIGGHVARAHYGIPADSFVFAYFGSINAYKNLDAMMAGFETVLSATRQPVHAIIGGVPSDPVTSQSLHQRWGMNPHVRLLLKNIPDHEIQYIHRAADVMVLPYGESLNSGAAYMAASFGKPFIMPEGAASSALQGLGVMTYDGSASGGLEQAMLSALSGQKAVVDAQLRDSHMPAVISNRFFDALDALAAVR